MPRRRVLAEVGVIGLAVCLVMGLTLVNLEKSRQTQRDLNRLGDLEAVAGALGVYRGVHGVYPPSTKDGNIRACGRHGEESCPWGKPWEDEKYIYAEKLPVDGLAVLGENWPEYRYIQTDGGEGYRLVMSLESESQPEIQESHRRCPGQWTRNQLVACPGM